MIARQVVGSTIGDYEIRAELGEGGMATVYRAYQPMLGREVALKVLSRALADEPGFLQRFANEARMLAKLDHPNIIPVYDFGNFGDITYIVSPLIGDGTLQDRMDDGEVDQESALSWLRQIADALHHAHIVGVTHRDLKPANILLHPDGRALLADFGLARASDQESLTMTGVALGTPGYMAPEQAMGAPIDERADVYALAVIAFEVLTGTRPYHGDRRELVMQTVQGQVPSAHERKPSLPADVDGLFAAALAKDPSQRIASAQDFVRRLNDILTHARTAPARTPAPAPPSAQAPPPASPSPPMPVAAPPSAQSPAAAPPSTPSPAASPQSAPAPAPADSAPPSSNEAPLTGIEIWQARISASTPRSGTTWPAVTPTPPAATPAGAARTSRPIITFEQPPTALLAERGIGPLEPAGHVLLDAHFWNAFHAATHIAGEHWADLVTTSGLPYLLTDPADGEGLNTPLNELAQLNEAIDVTFGAHGPEQQRRWGSVTMQLEIERTPVLSGQRRRLRLMPPGHQRRIRALLTAYCTRQDQVRGEHCAAWSQASEGEFWLVVFGNPYVFGKQRPVPSCHAVVGQLEALLRWIGLANRWTVTEIECGCVSAGRDCVFAVRSADA